MEHTITVKRIKDQQEALEAIQAAEQDAQFCQTAPTHVIRKPDGTVVGYWSFGNIAMCPAWHRTDMKVRESENLFATATAMASDRGWPAFVVPLEPNSPYIPYMERWGFRNAGNAVLFIKEV